VTRETCADIQVLGYHALRYFSLVIERRIRVTPVVFCWTTPFFSMPVRSETNCRSKRRRHPSHLYHISMLIRSKACRHWGQSHAKGSACGRCCHAERGTRLTLPLWVVSCLTSRQLKPGGSHTERGSTIACRAARFRVLGGRGHTRTGQQPH
jgi:hypothetical protein